MRPLPSWHSTGVAIGGLPCSRHVIVGQRRRIDTPLPFARGGEHVSWDRRLWYLHRWCRLQADSEQDGPID
jgi:hypothetical protein